MHERIEQQWLGLAEIAPFFTSLDAENQRLIQWVWACSDYFARYCLRHPAEFERIWCSGRLQKRHDTALFMAYLSEAFADIGDEAVLMRRLREVRNEVMISIAWRDLRGLADLDETLLATSDLADGLTGQALDWLYAEQCTLPAGTPLDDRGDPQRLVVLGLGKLGGRELNFSSDIDLMFAFVSKGNTSGTHAISNESFFKLLGQRLIKVLNTPTVDGFVFRVDMRLRPFGDSGALATSFGAMEDYYQIHGREWERYALIKARVIAGDKVAGKALLARLRGFIYRRYLDYGSIESLREMKILISQEAARKGFDEHLKLGPGGIREIEFIAQLFQLIHGGRDRHLRRSSLQPVLRYLWERALLPEHTVDELTEAYRFLRRAENHLQMMDDRQVHGLPENETDRCRLASSLGYQDWAGFYVDLESHRQRVVGYFQQVFAAPQLEEPSGDTQQARFAVVWRLINDKSLDHVSVLRELGFAESESSFRALQVFSKDRRILSLSVQGRQRLDRLMPLLLSAVSEYEQAGSVLRRLLDLLISIVGRTAYLSLLGEQPMVLSQLIRLCAASPWLAEYLTRYPILLDELIDPNALYSPPDREHLQAELAREFSRLDLGDQEQVMDRLRYFKQAQTLRVAAADIVGALPVTRVSDHLTWLAEVILEKVFETAWETLVIRYGEPEYHQNGKRLPAGFIIVAYGKLGGIELSYGSDLDLVFIHDSQGSEQITSGEKSVANRVFFTRLAQRIIHLLSVLTPAGALYEIDMRLRPSGRSGLMVSSLQAFKQYQRESAWVWEQQALVRARPIAGARVLAEQFIGIRSDVLCRKRDAKGLATDVRGMREKMWQGAGGRSMGKFNLKKSPGGITDIEFMVQYLVLLHAHRYPQLCRWTDNTRILEEIVNCGIASAETMRPLVRIYQQMRDEIHRRLLLGIPVEVQESAFHNERMFVQQCWQKLLKK
jgi:glutamate-ammonia-ligase adenylyltransferase